MEENKSFAQGLNFFKLFWIFILGCFCGVIIEMLWCLLTNGYIESRTALVLTPLNPVYGFGALLITVILVKLNYKSMVKVFFATAIIGGVFEYLCSFFQEMVFGTVSWIYTKETLGIFERTSLVYCVFWGILGIAWMKWIYPWLCHTIETIPNKIGKPLTYLLLAIFCFDAMLSSGAVYRQKQRRENIPATNKIHEFYDTHYNDQVLKKIYPNMHIINKKRMS